MTRPTPQQFVELRLALEKLRSELSEAVELTSESARPVDLDEPIGRLSRMDALQNQQMASANERAHAERLKRVEQAIAAMDRGRYGVCEVCSGSIGYERLRAFPESLVCTRCRERLDDG